MAVMEVFRQNWNFTLRKTVLKWAVLSSLLHYMNLWIILKNSGPVRLLIPTYPIFSWNYPNLWLFLIFKIREKWQFLNIFWHIYIFFNNDNSNWIEKHNKMDSLQSDPKLALKTVILVPKVANDLPEFKIRPWDHIAIIYTWSTEHYKICHKCQ